MCVSLTSFSVLMSVYKKDDPIFFEQALKSIAEQTVLPDEFILVCDGDVTKDIESIIKSYDSFFLRNGVRFINVLIPVNQGLGNALKVGSQSCTSDYIVRMDSDDISTQDRIETLHTICLENNEIDVVGTYIEEFFTNNPENEERRLRKVPLTGEYIETFSKKRNPMNHVTVCIKRLSLEKCGGYEDVHWHEDYYLWHKMLLQGYKLQNFPIITVLVRLSGFEGRRLGLTYLKSEVNFLKKCLTLGVITRLDTIKYMLPRLFLRVLPGKAVNLVYSFLRKHL